MTLVSPEQRWKQHEIVIEPQSQHREEAKEGGCVFDMGNHCLIPVFNHQSKFFFVTLL